MQLYLSFFQETKFYFILQYVIPAAANVVMLLLMMGMVNARNM
jgi:hypothetical protein